MDTEPISFEIETVPEALLRSGSFTHMMTWDHRWFPLDGSSSRPSSEASDHETDVDVLSNRRRLDLWRAAHTSIPCYDGLL